MALFHLLAHQVVDGSVGILSLVGIDRPDAGQFKHLLHTGCGVNLADITTTRPALLPFWVVDGLADERAAIVQVSTSTHADIDHGRLVLAVGIEVGAELVLQHFLVRYHLFSTGATLSYQ